MWRTFDEHKYLEAPLLGGWIATWNVSLCMALFVSAAAIFPYEIKQDLDERCMHIEGSAHRLL